MKETKVRLMNKSLRQLSWLAHGVLSLTFANSCRQNTDTRVHLFQGPWIFVAVDTTNHEYSVVIVYF